MSYFKLYAIEKTFYIEGYADEGKEFNGEGDTIEKAWKDFESNIEDKFYFISEQGKIEFDDVLYNEHIEKQKSISETDEKYREYYKKECEGELNGHSCSTCNRT